MSKLIGVGPRAIVERLLRADIRQQDLHSLFFDLRELLGGKGLVGEIGHFLAHPGIRDQGLVKREVSDQIRWLKFILTLSKSRFVPTDLPENAAKILRGNFRRLTNSITKREIGMNHIRVGRVLERILGRMAPTGLGGLQKPRFSNKEELEVFTLVARYGKGGSYFTDNDLVDDLSKALETNKYLYQAELSSFKKAQSGISLFALITMHGAMIDLGDGTKARIAIAEDVNGMLGAFAFSEPFRTGTGSTTVAAWVFETKLPIADYCAPGVAPLRRNAFIGDFEMSSELKLVRFN